MKNKKLNLGKITITKLNNLDHIRGGQIGFTGVPTLDNGLSIQTCIQAGCPDDTKTNPDNEDLTEICPD
ncbi:hypothetical protein [Aquimarina sp. 2304DJ70-9]|uniref:hypothetical protein n=1 Tax=Aquimarina penaris TaxID=3231044 RepID=UPI003462F973